jgi:hypothetical protein
VIRSLSILAMSLWICTAGQPQSRNDVIRLQTTVQDVVPLADFSGVITPIDFDPSFALTVRIESAVPAATNLKRGAVVTLGIHSPSLTFGGEPTKGKAYDFVLNRKIEDGKVKFFGLKVRNLEAHKSDTANR